MARSIPPIPPTLVKSADKVTLYAAIAYLVFTSIWQLPEKIEVLTTKISELSTKVDKLLEKK